MGAVFGTLRNLAIYILGPCAGAEAPFAFRVQAQGTAGEGVHVAVDIPAPGLGEEETGGGGGGVANASDVQAQGTVGEGDIDGGDGAGAHVSEVIILTICTQGAAVYAAVHKGLREISASTADSYKVAYLLAIAAVFVASLAQMLGAIWVSYNTRARGAAGKKILYASVVTLVFGILLDALAYLLKK